MDSVLEDSQPKAVKAQGNNVGPVGVKRAIEIYNSLFEPKSSILTRLFPKPGVWEGLDVSTRMSVEFFLRGKV